MAESNANNVTSVPSNAPPEPPRSRKSAGKKTDHRRVDPTNADRQKRHRSKCQAAVPEPERNVTVEPSTVPP
jgi:hypothetical protein